MVIPQPANRTGRIAARLIWLLANALALTLRWRWNDRSGLFGTGGGTQRIIIGIWHNRLALSLILYRNYVQRRWPARRMAALVSASRDGGMLARVLELFSVRPVRGSSSRRGAQALRELATSAGEGFDIAITPDGPRGPCYEVQDGVIATAQLTGLPILAVSYRLGWKLTLKSWDRFQIPLPFSRVEVEVSEPIWVPTDADADARERLRLQLQSRLRNLTRD